MPFMTNPNLCRVCLQPNKTTRLKYHYVNKKYYLQTTCKDCEKIKFQKYQKTKADYFNRYNREYYKKQVGGKLSRTSPLEMTDELRKQKATEKSLLRATRAKKARVSWDKELTKFVYKEAHCLRKARDAATKIKWHVDHVIPLKGKIVCGLHVWNNFAVIPKVENLRKGNRYSVHDKWQAGL